MKVKRSASQMAILWKHRGEGCGDRQYKDTKDFIQLLLLDLRDLQLDLPGVATASSSMLAADKMLPAFLVCPRYISRGDNVDA